jgi:hypothetical protein
VETGCQGGQGSPRAVAPSEEERSPAYDELKWVRKDPVVTSGEVCPNIRPEGLQKARNRRCTSQDSKRIKMAVVFMGILAVFK